METVAMLVIAWLYGVLHFARLHGQLEFEKGHITATRKI